MYRLLHRLFGWDYVSMDYGFSTYIRRIQKSPSGKEYIKLFGSLYFLPLQREYGSWHHLTRKT